MKIVHVGFSHRPDDIRIFQKECVSLAKYGHQVFYVTSNKNVKLADDVYKNVHVIIVDLCKTNRLKRFLVYCKDAKKILCSINGDAYHFHEIVLLPLLQYMKFQKKWVIYDLHEDTPRQMLPLIYRKLGNGFGKILVKFIELYENYCIKKADYVIAATPHIEQRCKKITDKVKCVANYPLLYNTENIEISFGEREKIVCYTGGISKINGIFNIVRAMQKIDGTLYLAGTLPKELEVQLEKYNGWSKVRELGYVKREEVQKILQKSMVGLVLYLPSGNTVDALPNKLFEYMEAGLPVVVSDFPLWKSIVEENQCGICVNPNSPIEIADAINKILDSPKWAEEMGEKGRILVQKKYNWQTQEKKLLEVYDKMISI